VSVHTFSLRPTEGSRLSGKTREGISEGKPVNNEAAVWQCGGKNEETTKAATAFFRLLPAS
jgi:hypothetical protein